MKKMLLAAGLGLLLCGAAGAQAPAGAPSGATGICKDGSYWTGTTKSGACRGHKGIQTWFADSPTAASSATKPAATPVPTPGPATASRPTPTPAPAPAAMPAPAASTAKKGPAAAAAAKTAAPGGAPGLVWVNTESNVYHCYGDTYYGKTKAGAYMSEADAKAKGAHAARGAVCSK